MNIDVTEQLTTVTRTVGTRTLQAGETRTVVVSRTYDTTIDDLWDACTNAERIPRWFLPVTGELKLGGHYQLDGNAGGTIETCDPPSAFTATWEFGGSVTWIELRLTTVDDGTRFELEHIGQLDDPQWDEYGPGAVGVGWDLGLLGLSLHMAGEATVDPAEVAAWTASPDGKAFIRGSSEGWRTAHVTAGEEDAKATASAKNTAAFYTGEPA